MFEGLKKSLGNILDKLSKTELNEKKLEAILQDFKLALLENDVALSVTDRICNEVKIRLKGVEVKRFEGRKNIVEKALREILRPRRKEKKGERNPHHSLHRC
jgi:signal recognition particle GTPase